MRLWVLRGTNATTMDRITGGNILSFIFEVALVALLLHPTSREHQRVWYK